MLHCLCVVFAPCVSTVSVQAETVAFACVLTDDCYFYAEKNETRGLFLLPKTYFVKIVERDGEFTQIEYLTDGENTKKVRGYAKTDLLTFVDFTPKNPYLYHTFDVRYVVDGSTPIDSSFIGSITLRCTYYGDYTVGTNTYCYILRDGVFGYVPKPLDFSYAENTEYAEHLSSRPPPTSSTLSPNESEAMSPAQIAVLIALCLLVPTLAALILKPPKRLPYETDDFS